MRLYRFCFALLIGCVFLGVGTNALAQERGRLIIDKPLNVVWLSVEDMSPWIGPYGDKTVPTPNLDKLAAEGVTYDNAFATSPVCAGPVVHHYRHVLHAYRHHADAQRQSLQRRD